MASLLSVNMCIPTVQYSTGTHKVGDNLQSGRFAYVERSIISTPCCFRMCWNFICFVSNAKLVLTPLPAIAEEESNVEDKEESVVGALKSLFDPNEKTKSGKVLPKAYLNSAREVVKTLRESLKEDPKDIGKFRRTADAAKESIRGYISSWRGQKTVVNEESYIMLEKAIRSLANFYSRAGPSASLPETIKSEILGDLTTAEEFL